MSSKNSILSFDPFVDILGQSLAPSTLLFSNQAEQPIGVHSLLRKVSNLSVLRRLFFVVEDTVSETTFRPLLS